MNAFIVPFQSVIKLARLKPSCNVFYSKAQCKKEERVRSYMSFINVHILHIMMNRWRISTYEPTFSYKFCGYIWLGTKKRCKHSHPCSNFNNALHTLKLYVGCVVDVIRMLLKMFTDSMTLPKSWFNNCYVLSKTCKNMFITCYIHPHKKFPNKIPSLSRLLFFLPFISI